VPVNTILSSKSESFTKSAVTKIFHQVPIDIEKFCLTEVFNSQFLSKTITDIGLP
jgi:hypothetical protein